MSITGGGSRGFWSPAWRPAGVALVHGAYYALAAGLILADGPLPAGDAAALGLLARLRLAGQSSSRGWKTAVGLGMIAVPGESLVLTPAGIALGEFLEGTFGASSIPGSHSMWIGPEVIWFYE